MRAARRCRGFQTGTVDYSLVASGPNNKRQSATLEIVSRDDRVAARLIAEVRRLMVEHSVLRG